MNLTNAIFIVRQLAHLPSRFKSQKDISSKPGPLIGLFVTHQWLALNPSKFHNHLMSRKTNRLSKLDASVLEAQIRCGTDWPIGLVDAIAEAHQTTVRYVIERQRILRSTEPHNDQFNSYLWHYLKIYLMSLSVFEIGVGGITSIPLTSILVLIFYKVYGEKRLQCTKLKVKKLASQTKPTTHK